MKIMSRRLAIRASLCVAASTTLARPYIANAQAKTAEVWWTQGFVQEEDVAFRNIVANYQKISGNTIDFSIIPFAPMRQKIVSAVTSGIVPDLFQNTPGEMIALYAWDDKLLDVATVLWATGVVGPGFLAASGLACDEAGCVRVDTCLHSISHRFVFAAGDCATIEGNARPKAGVWAVRAGAPLAANLRRAARVLGRRCSRI